MTPRDPAWVEASAQLRRLVAAAVDEPTPCMTSPRAWTDPRDEAEVAAAVSGCGACRLLRACRGFAEVEQPREVVLAGRYWPLQAVAASG